SISVDEYVFVTAGSNTSLSEYFLSAFAFCAGVGCGRCVLIKPIGAQVTCYRLRSSFLITFDVLATGRLGIRQQYFAVALFLFRCAVAASGWGHGVVSFSLKLCKLRLMDSTPALEPTAKS